MPGPYKSRTSAKTVLMSDRTLRHYREQYVGASVMRAKYIDDPFVTGSYSVSEQTPLVTTFQLFRDIRIILMTPCRGKPNACRRSKRDRSVSSVSR